MEFLVLKEQMLNRLLGTGSLLTANIDAIINIEKFPRSAEVGMLVFFHDALSTFFRIRRIISLPPPPTLPCKPLTAPFA